MIKYFIGKKILPNENLQLYRIVITPLCFVYNFVIEVCFSVSTCIDLPLSSITSTVCNIYTMFVYVCGGVVLKSLSLSLSLSLSSSQS